MAVLLRKFLVSFLTYSWVFQTPPAKPGLRLPPPQTAVGTYRTVFAETAPLLPFSVFGCCRVESTRVASLRSQRDETLGDLRQRFGGDAVERAAFAFFSGVHKDGAGRGGAEWGGRRADGEAPLDGDRVDEPASTSGSFGDHDDGECPKIPVSMIAKALRPAYGPDCDCGGDGDSTTLLTTEAVAEAVASACGADCSTMSEGERQGLRLTFEDFLVVAERLTRSKVEDHAARSD